MGMIVNCYRHLPYQDASNGGLSSKHQNFTLVNADGPFEPTQDSPAVIMVKGNLPNTVKIVPAERSGDGWVPVHGWFMFGGTYLAGDSRVDKLAESLGAPNVGIYAFHDRMEQP